MALFFCVKLGATKKPPYKTEAASKLTTTHNRAQGTAQGDEPKADNDIAFTCFRQPMIDAKGWHWSEVKRVVKKPISKKTVQEK